MLYSLSLDHLSAAGSSEFCSLQMISPLRLSAALAADRNDCARVFGQCHEICFIACNHERFRVEKVSSRSFFFVFEQQSIWMDLRLSATKLALVSIKLKFMNGRRVQQSNQAIQSNCFIGLRNVFRSQTGQLLSFVPIDRAILLFSPSSFHCCIPFVNKNDSNWTNHLIVAHVDEQKTERKRKGQEGINFGCQHISNRMAIVNSFYLSRRTKEFFPVAAQCVGMMLNKRSRTNGRPRYTKKAATDTKPND